MNLGSFTFCLSTQPSRAAQPAGCVCPPPPSAGQPWRRMNGPVWSCFFWLSCHFKTNCHVISSVFGGLRFLSAVSGLCGVFVILPLSESPSLRLPGLGCSLVANKPLDHSKSIRWDILYLCCYYSASYSCVWGSGYAGRRVVGFFSVGKYISLTLKKWFLRLVSSILRHKWNMTFFIFNYGYGVRERLRNRRRWSFVFSASCIVNC